MNATFGRPYARAVGQPPSARPERRGLSEMERALLGCGVAVGSALWWDLERERAGISRGPIAIAKTEAA